MKSNESTGVSESDQDLEHSTRCYGRRCIVQQVGKHWAEIYKAEVVKKKIRTPGS